MAEEKVKCGSGGGVGFGGFWFVGWLFTLAFAKLTFWQALLGLFIWPYYLGMVLR